MGINNTLLPDEPIAIELGGHPYSAVGLNGGFAARVVSLENCDFPFNSSHPDNVRLSVRSKRPGRQDPIVLYLTPEEATALGQALLKAGSWKVDTLGQTW